MSDIWTMGELLVEVMRPKAGMTLYETGSFLGPYPSGAPGIFIDTAARLEHSAGIISGVGEDDFGRCIVDRLRADGVDTRFVQSFPHRSTGVAFVTYFEDGSRSFIFHWDGTPAVMARLPEPAEIQGPKYFHLMGCSLMANDAFREEMFRAVELFAAKGARVTFDPNVRLELLRDRTVEEIVGPILRHCSVLFPGEKELELLTGEAKAEQAARALFARYPLEVLVLKRGSRGCRVYTARERVDVPAFRIEEVDPTGSGDCFDAGFLCGLLEGRDLVESARVAAAVGALNAKAFGPMEGKISPQAVQALLDGGETG
ncbi:MAG: sugar kinase [Spirochaetales bacterium]|nr:sugar kinase [Spirochaetales bacterium]